MPNLSEIIAPTNVITTDNVITLTNKTVDFANNSLTGVASTDTAQTLTNKTITFGDNSLTDVASTDTSQTLTNKIITFGDNSLTDVASTDTSQTLTNKTINFANNTLTGVASTDTAQTLTNKTFNAPVFNNDSEFNGTVTIQDVNEKTVIDTSTTGTLVFNCADQGILYLTVDQTADRTINFVGDGSTPFDSYLDINDAVTVAVLFTNGSTAYSFTAFEVDGASVTPQWQGGSAPTGGNANSIDSYLFTIIKTDVSTYTVLGSQTQFA